MTKQELLTLRQKIDEQKETVSRLKGKREALLDELQKDFGCTTIEEANKLYERKQKELKKKEDELKKKITLFKKKFGDLLA